MLGLFQKYIVSRRDMKDRPGCKHDGCKLFVLDYSCDPHAKVALAAYADSCAQDYPTLSADLKAALQTP